MKLYFEDNSKQYQKKDFAPKLKKIFEKFKLNDKIELGIKLTDNAEIKKLNRKFRQTDQPTDVLSFPIDKPQEREPKRLMLGDIVISREIAQDKKEISKLINHGLLHLLGFDHEKNQKEWQRALSKIDN